MRIDLLSIFPQYFAALDLSLMGKARQSGQLDIHVHDLRSWTHDRHRTVDDTPYGGGAGMVMRPDVWGEALDTVIGAEPVKCVLAIPTPSGIPFNQKKAEELSHFDRIIVACGRYEGSALPITTVTVASWLKNSPSGITSSMVGKWQPWSWLKLLAA